MQWNLLQLLIPKKFLGIDIGTSFVKIVEISRFGNRRKLESYGSMPASVLYGKKFRTFDKNTLLLSSNDISRAIKAVMDEARMKTKQVVFSLPDFSTFFTSFELPPMSGEELQQAVVYEARQHVPLPLGEVTLDWQIIEGKTTDKKNENLKILLVAVPNEVINQYREIATLADLELLALEAEAFSLARSIIDEDEKRNLAIIDIGSQSTTCNIVEKKVLKMSHSFDTGGNELTKIISKSLNIEYHQAEEFKKNYGISGREEEVRQIMLPLIDIILSEIQKIFDNFYRQKGKHVEKIILSGGVALMPGLKEYFFESFKKEIEIANPFLNLFYPPILENTLKEMGPSYTIAVGSALRGTEY